MRLPESQAPLAVLFRYLNQPVKTVLVVNGHLGKHFPINFNIGFFKTINKTAVRDPVGAGGSINPGDPEFTEVPFPLPAIPVGI